MTIGEFTDKIVIDLEHCSNKMPAMLNKGRISDQKILITIDTADKLYDLIHTVEITTKDAEFMMDSEENIIVETEFEWKFSDIRTIDDIKDIYERNRKPFHARDLRIVYLEDEKN